MIVQFPISVHFPNNHYCTIFGYKLNYCKAPHLNDDDDFVDKGEKVPNSKSTFLGRWVNQSIRASLPRQTSLSLSFQPRPLLPPSCSSVPCVIIFGIIMC